MARRPTGRTRRSPQRGSPLEEYPSPAAVPRHRGPLPSCCYRSVRCETRSRMSPISGRAPRRACRRTGVLASSLDLLRRRAPLADQPCRVPAPQRARRRTARRGRGVGPKAPGSLAVPPPPEGGGGLASIRRWSGTGSTSHVTRGRDRPRPAVALREVHLRGFWLRGPEGPVPPSAVPGPGRPLRPPGGGRCIGFRRCLAAARGPGAPRSSAGLARPEGRVGLASRPVLRRGPADAVGGFFPSAAVDRRGDRRDGAAARTNPCPRSSSEALACRSRPPRHRVRLACRPEPAAGLAPKPATPRDGACRARPFRAPPRSSRRSGQSTRDTVTGLGARLRASAGTPSSSDPDATGAGSRAASCARSVGTQSAPPASPVARRGVQRFVRRAANFRALLH